jgi:hypothetical protein
METKSGKTESTLTSPLFLVCALFVILVLFGAA